MKLNNYPLTILLSFGLFAIGCESVRQEELRTKTAEQIAAEQDTARIEFFKQQLSEAQIDSVWRAQGY